MLLPGIFQDQSGGGGQACPKRSLCEFFHSRQVEIIRFHPCHIRYKTADLACGGVSTHQHLPVQEDAAADAGAQHQHQTVFYPGQCARPALGSGGTLAIVGDGHRHAQPCLYLRSKGLLPQKGTEHSTGMGDAVSGIDAARHRDGAAHELSLKGSGKALDDRQKVIHIRQRCRNLAAGDFPGLFIGQTVLDKRTADVDQKILFHPFPSFFFRQIRTTLPH